MTLQYKIQTFYEFVIVHKSEVLVNYYVFLKTTST